MTNRQIETSREIRLWVAQIAIPALAVIAMAKPETKEAIADKVESVKKTIQNKFKK